MFGIPSRAPICFNPPAARSYLPLTIKKTELVLAAQSKAQMFEDIEGVPNIGNGSMDGLLLEFTLWP